MLLRKVSVSLVLVASAVFASGCMRAGDVSVELPTPEPSPAASPLPRLELKRDAALEAEFANIAEEAKGKVGVAAVVLETGEAALLNADGRYPMHSVYKLPIAMAVMEQVRLGKLDLDEVVGVTKDDMIRQGMHSRLRDKNPDGGEFPINELIRLSLVESDGVASDVLMRVAGGAGEIQSYLTQIGITDIKVANTEKEIGRDWETQYQNWATPSASVDLLRALNAAADGWLPPELAGGLTGGQELLHFMFVSNPGEKRIKGMMPILSPSSVARPKTDIGGSRPRGASPSILVAHKTGTGGTRNGVTSATNDIGIVYMPDRRRFAIAIYVSDSPADEKTREAVIAKIAKAAWDKWSKN